MDSTKTLPATDSSTDLHSLIGADSTADFETDPKFMTADPTASASSESLYAAKDEDEDVEDDEVEDDEEDDDDEDEDDDEEDDVDDLDNEDEDEDDLEDDDEDDDDEDEEEDGEDDK